MNRVEEGVKEGVVEGGKQNILLNLPGMEALGMKTNAST